MLLGKGGEITDFFKHCVSQGQFKTQSYIQAASHTSQPTRQQKPPPHQQNPPPPQRPHQQKPPPQQQKPPPPQQPPSYQNTPPPPNPPKPQQQQYQQQYQQQQPVTCPIAQSEKAFDYTVNFKKMKLGRNVFPMAHVNIITKSGFVIALAVIGKDIHACHSNIQNMLFHFDNEFQD